MNRLKSFIIFFVCIACLSVFAFAIESIDIDSKASILIDAKDGHEIYSENADTKQYPASITKLMTALLVAENIDDWSEEVVANKSAFQGLSDAGSSVGIKAGEKMSVDNLVICLLVASANESANILAERVSGSVEAFVELMNSRAAELGLEGTHFVNTNGLHDDDHYTTARDVAKLAMEVRKHPRLREIYGMDKATIPATNLSEERFFFTTNSLISRYKELGYIYSKANGMKTGSTTPAGLCLVASAEYNGKELISVVLGATKNEETGKKGSFVESKKLLVWGFENFKYAKLLLSSQAVCEVHVEAARDRDYVVAHTEKDYEVLMPKDYDESKVELVTNTQTELMAPVKKGDAIGTVTIKYDGKEYETLNLVAADDVERSIIAYAISAVGKFMKSPIAYVVIGVVLVAIAAYIIYVIRYNRRRKNRRRRYYR
ncbi:MAG: D-alanyl-D-alanine carboxypeptidase [Oscillospiraceae bacterium]|nr:D-alanyl-D-alanine carboxypeptidase [Oscillospiraceae bacterium]